MQLIAEVQFQLCFKEFCIANCRIDLQNLFGLREDPPIFAAVLREQFLWLITKDNMLETYLQLRAPSDVLGSLLPVCIIFDVGGKPFDPSTTMHDQFGAPIEALGRPACFFCNQSDVVGLCHTLRPCLQHVGFLTHPNHVRVAGKAGQTSSPAGQAGQTSY